MKTLNTQHRKLIFASLFLFVFSAIAASNIEVRLTPASQTEKAIFVNVQVRSTDQGAFNLGGQNYRIFYNNVGVSLDKKASLSLLSSKDYSKIDFTEVKEGIHINGDRQLDFESDMGYANFSIDLTNLQEGGVRLTGNEEWNTVARLKFDITDAAKTIDIVWGREGMSDTYATAFVEMSEWKSAYNTAKVTVDFYGDLHSEIAETANQDALEVTVGPNPSTDFVNIEFSERLTSSAIAYVFDLSGKVMKQVNLAVGNKNTRFDVTDLSAASYLVELRDSEAQSIHRQLIVVAK